MHKFFWVVAVFLLGVSARSAPAPITGKIFFTDAERTEIDRGARKSTLAKNDAPKPPVEVGEIRVNGGASRKILVPVTNIPDIGVNKK